MVLKEVLIVADSMTGGLCVYASFVSTKISQIQKEGFLVLGICLLVSAVCLAIQEAWSK